jgi:WD40 repeat protein
MGATADGKKLITGSLEGSVNLWELDAGRTPRMLEKDGMWVKAAAFSPDGSKLAFAHNMDFSVRVWGLVPSSSK